MERQERSDAGSESSQRGNTVSLTSMAGGESEKMYVQDVSGVSHADKLSAIFESMKLSMTFDNKEVEENVWMINSLSSFDGGYVEGAVRVAPTVWSFLSGEDVSEMVSGIAWDPSWKKSEEGPLGIVFMDFAAEESDELSFATLTEMIRLNNWNYVMKKDKASGYDTERVIVDYAFCFHPKFGSRFLRVYGRTIIS